MTKNDVAKLVSAVMAYYPQFYKDYDKNKTLLLISAWFVIFEDYEYDTVSAALKAFIANDTKGFPPVPGMLIDKIDMLENSEELNEITAWGIVSQALKNSIYGADEEFNKLPDIIKKCIRNPAILREWAKLDESEVQTVIQSNFMRTFRAVTETEKQRAKIPQSVLKMIENKALERKNEKLLQ